MAAAKRTALTIDKTNPGETFEFLCEMSGVPPDRDASMDIDGFVLAFEQLFNAGVPLDPEQVDELKIYVGSEREEDVSLSDWSKFHRKWTDASTMDALLESQVQAKAARKEAADREKEYEKALVKVKKDAAKKKEADGRPVLMADMARERLEQAGGAAQLAAQHRSLDPAAWGGVIEGVGGLDAPLEAIRRRVWVPLCAPTSLLNELGAERVKGLLLHGPPGCGKSLLGARLAAGLSRRPPTLVSGPEIMDKYVGNSEAQLRNLFTSPPRVTPQPGDAEDTMKVLENNELHIIVLDEFDAIARKRSDEVGGSEGGAAARDSVVNQLLALMDGVAMLPVPTFVIALTNRRELVDLAVLRPGRLEVQVECGKPDAKGRDAILRIHAEKMRESGRLSLDGSSSASGECTLERVDDGTYDGWIERLAERTDGFSGAAIAAIVRAAVARALDRSVSDNDTAGCRVTGGDFDKAIDDVRQSSLELEMLEAAEAGVPTSELPPTGGATVSATEAAVA